MEKTLRLNLLIVIILPLLAANIAYAANLPSDPGEAGKVTLAGIDSDNDGVRDDVQRWIALTYPNSEKVRSALTQEAKINQLYILNALDSVLSKSTARKVILSLDCLSYVSPDAYVAVGRKFDALFFNTYARSKAQIQADHHSSGTVFGSLSYENRKQGCDFNPDTMLN
jgi:hypothetical protein